MRPARSPRQAPDRAAPAAVARLCPGCGLSDARLLVVDCPGCGLPRAMRDWTDARADDAGGAVAAGLLTTGAVGVAAVALAAMDGSLSTAITAAVLASPLLGTGGWGAQELRAFRRRQRGQGHEYRCTSERLVSGGMWWVEARVYLDEQGEIAQGQGRARRPVVDAPLRSREQVPDDDWTALWLLALFEAQSELAIDTAQQWDWSCATSPEAAPGPEAPYREAPADRVVWQHLGGRPQAVVSMLDRLEVSYGMVGFQVGANVRVLAPWLTHPIELGKLLAQMRASSDPALLDQLARCRAFLATEPTSMQRRTGALAALAGR